MSEVGSSGTPYEYVTLRYVPRPEREEFLNVGVILHCQAIDYLAASWTLTSARLLAFDPTTDLDRLRSALEFVDAVCAGEESAGAVATVPDSQRFGFLKAPRSTVLQPGPVHGGLTKDPARALLHLHDKLVS